MTPPSLASPYGWPANGWMPYGSLAAVQWVPVQVPVALPSPAVENHPPAPLPASQALSPPPQAPPTEPPPRPLQRLPMTPAPPLPASTSRLPTSPPPVTTEAQRYGDAVGRWVTQALETHPVWLGKLKDIELESLLQNPTPFLEGLHAKVQSSPPLKLLLKQGEGRIVEAFPPGWRPTVHQVIRWLLSKDRA